MKKKVKAPAKILLADDMGLEPGRELRSQRIKQWAGFLAKHLGLSIDLVNVEDPYLYPLKPYYKSIIEEYLHKQEAKLKTIAKSFETPARSLYVCGDPVQKILALCSKEKPYELVALGTHGRKGFSRFILGSVSEEVIRNASIPVLVVGPKAQEQARDFKEPSTIKILVPTALTPNSEPAETYAISLAKRLGAEVILFHSMQEALHPVLQTAFSVPSAEKGIADLFIEVRADAMKNLNAKTEKWKKKGITVTVLLDEKTTSSSDAVLAEAQKQKATLIVMGTHGRSFASGAFFGRTVRGVILEASIPVVTVRSKKS